MNSQFFFPALTGESSGRDGYFGALGGKYIPEALVAAVDEVAVEDLNRTGSHKINNVLGQALLTTRMGKPRVIAETGAGQPWSISAGLDYPGVGPEHPYLHHTGRGANTARSPTPLRCGPSGRSRRPRALSRR